jgi:hypothetical protein
MQKEASSIRNLIFLGEINESDVRWQPESKLRESLLSSQTFEAGVSETWVVRRGSGRHLFA